MKMVVTLESFYTTDLLPRYFLTIDPVDCAELSATFSFPLNQGCFTHEQSW